jgi:hypothetical protein
MKHPVESDFDTSVTEAGVTVVFKPTNSIYSFYRLMLAALVHEIRSPLPDARGRD